MAISIIGRRFLNKKILHSSLIDKNLLDKARQAAKKAGISTSIYVREAIIDKVGSGGKLAELEERINKLENKILQEFRGSKKPPQLCQQALIE